MAKQTNRSLKKGSKKTTIDPASVKGESNKYDKIVKENLKPLLKPLLRRVLGLNFHSIKFLPVTKQQTTLEREPDFICIIHSEEYPNGVIVHIEFQTKGDGTMADRILELVGIERRRHKRPVLPYVICLGEEKPFISNEINEKGLYFTFPVHYLIDEPFEDFINSDDSEEVILAILTNFNGKNPEDVIRMIINRLKQLNGDTEMINRFLIHLQVISKLRNLQPQTFKIIDDMVFDFKLEEDIAYQKGTVIGKSIGEVIGEARGEARGEAKGDYKRTEISTFNMLDQGFEINAIAGILGVPLDVILNIQKLWLAKKN
jgi:hypothetical protein